ncbi:MAG: phosphotransferase [Lachnospiraceae bacterium]|nr:phosphotransferase [Lachnospiraceae bacterium]
MISKLLLKQGTKYIDVSGYKLIIWGTECARSLSAKLQLDDIDMVVDENPEVCGNAICLYGRNYTVTSPESICEFANERAIVLIGSNLSIKGISEKIEYFWGENKEDYIVKSDDLYGYYESIEELLLSDPIMLKKIVDGNISKKIYGFILKINKIIEDNTENFSKIYIPIREGARISFIVSDKDFHPQNVMHFPVLSDREENNVYGVQALSQTFELKEKLHFDDSIKLYEDKAGFELERFGNVIKDWDNTELVRRVVSILREVHNTDISTDIVRDPWEKLLAVENHIRERSVNFPWELSEKIHKELSEEIRHYKPKLCHGDIICENVLTFNDEPVLIDWEWVGLSDPMFDLCRLSTSFKYSGFNGVSNKDMILEMYLDRVPTAEEKRHYEAMIAYDEYMRYCSYLLTGANRDKYTEKMVTKKIENANMLNMIIESWISIIDDDEKNKKISTLWEEWGALEIVDMICTEFSSYKNVFANYISDAKLLQQNNKTTKRMAFYYKKYGQGGVERVISLLIPLFLKAGYGVVLITEVPKEENDFILPNGVKRYVIPSKNEIDAGRIRYKERGKQLLDIYEKESIDTVSVCSVMIMRGSAGWQIRNCRSILSYMILKEKRIIGFSCQGS